MTDYTTFDAFKADLEQVAQADQQAQDAFWDTLQSQQQIPFVHGNRVGFLFRGEAFMVEWRGDFTRWVADEKTEGTRLGDSDIWFLEMTFPSDACMEYKIIIDDEVWLLDPDNQHRQWSGHGANSILYMPDFASDPLLIPRDDVARGDVSHDQIIHSDVLETAIRYWVYTSPGLAHDTPSPVLYFTDGHEYLDSRRGNVPIVLDNLLADGRIPPLRAVFIDPRQIEDRSINERVMWYVGHDDYAQFVAKELVAHIDANYATQAQAENRLLVGTSLGGVFSAFCGAQYSDVFGKLVIQSPAFKHYRPIYSLYRQVDKLPLNIWMASGRGYWDGDITRMTTLLTEKGYDVTTLEVNQGHSWGQWRNQISLFVTHFFGV